jgi:hypothetical protein
MASLEVKKKVKNAVLYTNGMIRIDNVRGSYVHLDKPYAGRADDGSDATPKFSIIGILPKETHEEAKKLIVEEMTRILDEKKSKVAKDKKFIRDGDDQEKDEYEGAWTVSAREERKPKCRDRAGNLVEDRDEIADMFVSGYWYNILIRPWYQDNKFGKRLNAGLVGVQFVRKDEPFGMAAIDDSDAWDAVDSDEDDFEDDADDGL